MANVMEWYKFSLDNTSGLMKPIIFCTSSEIDCKRIAKKWKLYDENYEDGVNAALFFPFNYMVDKTSLMEDDSFIFSNIGGEATVSLKEA